MVVNASVTWYDICKYHGPQHLRLRKRRASDDTAMAVGGYCSKTVRELKEVSDNHTIIQTRH